MLGSASATVLAGGRSVYKVEHERSQFAKWSKQLPARPLICISYSFSVNQSTPCSDSDSPLPLVMSIFRRVIILGSLLFFTSLTLSFSFTSRYQRHSTTKTEYRHLAHSDLFEDSYPEEEATSVSYSSANTKISAESLQGVL